MQLLESIMVALFIFIAIAVVSIHRLPTNPGAFAEAELQVSATDILKIRQAKVPGSDDDCNESPCPFEDDLVRLASLAMAYVGPTGAAETPDRDPIQDFLQEALPPGTSYLISYSNGYELTNLAPRVLSPPPGSVVVARAVVEPNWTVFAQYANSSASLRVQDITNFGDLSAGSIVDALGRIAPESGIQWKNTLDGNKRVPNNATYGTYKLCYGAACKYFNVVGPGSVGAGSQILAGDRTLTAGLRNWGAWAARIGYDSTATPGTLPYLKGSVSAAVVSVGDIRLFRLYPCRAVGVPPVNYDCAPGTVVRLNDPDVGKPLTTGAIVQEIYYSDVDSSTAYNEGDALYLDVVRLAPPNQNKVDVNDFRLSRVGAYEAGSLVTTGDQDVGKPLNPTPFDIGPPPIVGSGIMFLDRDGSGTIQEGEQVLLNLTWGGAQSPTLTVNDLYLTPVNLATQRYFYDIKLAVWYGV